MRSSVKTALLFIAGFLILQILVYYITALNAEQRIDKALNAQVANLKTHYEVILSNQHINADAAYRTTIAQKEVIDLFAQARSASPAKRDLLRQKLYRELIGKYEVMKTKGILQFHFVFPDNRVFLRMHKPDKYGDDLTEIRADFRYVNETKKPIRGFDQGRTAHGFRNVYPVFGKNREYLGAMEISYGSEVLQEQLTHVSKLHSHFLVDRELLDTKAWQREDMVLKYFRSAEHPDYMITMTHEHSKEICIDQNTVRLRPLLPRIDANMKKGDSFALYGQYKGELFVIAFYPVKNIRDNRVVAWLVSYSDDDFISATLHSLLYMRISLFVAFALIFFFVYKVMMQQRSLKQLNLSLKTAQDIAHLGFWELDVGSGRLFWSDEVYKIFGLRPGEIDATYENFLNFVHPDDRDKLDHAYRTSMEEHRSYHLTHRIIAKNGELKYVEERCNHEFDAKGKPLKSTGSVLDITERKLLEEELKELNAHLMEEVNKKVQELRDKERILLQQSKMASMGEMISAIAHQWKQPLNALGAIFQDIQDAYEYDELDKTLLDRSVAYGLKQIEFMGTTIDDFRRFLSPNKARDFYNFESTVDKIMTILGKQLANHNIEVEKQFDSIELYGVRGEMEQVLLNLLNNAKDAIVKRQEQEKLKGKITIEAVSDKEHVVVLIRDNGCGIPEDAADKVFESYFTTKGDKGTGIGLYMTKFIIEESMLGTIWIRNSDEGAEVSFDIPREIAPL